MLNGNKLAHKQIRNFGSEIIPGRKSNVGNEVATCKSCKYNSIIQPELIYCMLPHQQSHSHTDASTVTVTFNICSRRWLKTDGGLGLQSFVKELSVWSRYRVVPVTVYSFSLQKCTFTFMLSVFLKLRFQFKFI